MVSECGVSGGWECSDGWHYGAVWDDELRQWVAVQVRCPHYGRGVNGG